MVEFAAFCPYDFSSLDSKSSQRRYTSANAAGTRAMMTGKGSAMVVGGLGQGPYVPTLSVAPMKVDAFGRAFIEKEEEGGVPKLKAYNDGTGTWTIGFGHTSAAGLPRVYAGMVILPGEADAILGSDLAGVEANINHHVKVSLGQNQFNACASFDFNTGAFVRSGLLQLLNAGCTDRNKITAAFCAWRFARSHGVEVPELLGRRQREAVLFFTPDQSALQPLANAISQAPASPLPTGPLDS